MGSGHNRPRDNKVAKLAPHGRTVETKVSNPSQGHQAQTVVQPAVAETNPEYPSSGLCRAWFEAVHASGLFEERLYDPIVGFAVLSGGLAYEHNPDYAGTKDKKTKKKNSSAKSDGAKKSAPCITHIDWGRYGLCETCTSSIQKVWPRTRQKLWERLDIWMELSDGV